MDPRRWEQRPAVRDQVMTSDLVENQDLFCLPLFDNCIRLDNGDSVRRPFRITGLNALHRKRAAFLCDPACDFPIADLLELRLFGGADLFSVWTPRMKWATA